MVAVLESSPLQRRKDVLVLGATYEPLEQVGWRRAMTLWVSGRVEVVAHYDDRVVRTVRRALPMPAVVRFFRSLRRDRLAVKFNRDNIFQRDRGRCQYCRQTVIKREATYDHVMPRSRGGKKTWTNIVLACKACNQLKGNRTPDEARMQLAAPPRRPRYLPDLWSIRTTSHTGTIPTPWRPFLGMDAVGKARE